MAGVALSPAPLLGACSAPDVAAVLLDAPLTLAHLPAKSVIKSKFRHLYKPEIFLECSIPLFIKLYTNMRWIIWPITLSWAGVAHHNLCNHWEQAGR